MDVLIVKITNRENVDKILRKQEFSHIDINTLQTEVKVDLPIFIVFSGDKAKIDWEQGIIGFGHITRAPYDIGYRESKKSNYFKIDIKPDFVLDHPLDPKFTKLHPKYQEELYDAPYVGAKHFPNQAIAKASGKSMEALFHLFRDISPESVADFNYSFLNTEYLPNIELFKDFLYYRIPRLSQKSISNYMSGIKSVCSWYAMNVEDFFSKDVDDVKQIYQKTFADQRDITGKRMYSNAIKKIIEYISDEYTDSNNIKPPISLRLTAVSKPFMLLAGISGTGKSRFVRMQAERSAEAFSLKKGENYCIVPIRPDWHEPSDLLGYITRIEGTSYVPTDFLKFAVKALKTAMDAIEGDEIIWCQFNAVPPFWLCLDEMNLAPVEQYFADYLSILETRTFNGNEYKSEPLLKPSVFDKLGAEPSAKLLDILDIKDEAFADYVIKHGIPLSPNLIVAGTVNMDETTHGFSRKVLDRALTIDFQEFFPNNFDDFFVGQDDPKLFTFPVISDMSRTDWTEVITEDIKDKTVKFMKTLNDIFKGTSCELAYRALNELLLSVVSFGPYEGEDADKKLQAVWDDFLMQKVLPRIEGDSQKLRSINKVILDKTESDPPDPAIYGKRTILHDLYYILQNNLLKDIWAKNKKNKNEGEDSEESEILAFRPDLLRQTEDFIECRSKKKLEWMMRRLKGSHFTDFWV